MVILNMMVTITLADYLMTPKKSEGTASLYSENNLGTDAEGRALVKRGLKEINHVLAFLMHCDLSTLLHYIIPSLKCLHWHINQNLYETKLIKTYKPKLYT